MLGVWVSLVSVFRLISLCVWDVATALCDGRRTLGDAFFLPLRRPRDQVPRVGVISQSSASFTCGFKSFLS